MNDQADRPTVAQQRTATFEERLKQRESELAKRRLRQEEDEWKILLARAKTAIENEERYRERLRTRVSSLPPPNAAPRITLPPPPLPSLQSGEYPTLPAKPTRRASSLPPPVPGASALGSAQRQGTRKSIPPPLPAKRSAG